MTDKTNAVVPMAQFLTPSNMDEAVKAAQIMAESTLVPEAYQGRPGDILVAGQYAAELGVTWLQGMQNIAVINGRPCVWGDLLPALAMRHPDFTDMLEEWDEATQTATCTVIRKGRADTVQTFSKADAIEAGLLDKKVWQKYARRMCQMRARSWAIRDAMPDALRGFYVAEEIIDVTPEPPAVIDAATKAESVTDKLKAVALAQADAPAAGSLADFENQIGNATTEAQLRDIAQKIRAVEQMQPGFGEPLREVYQARRIALASEPQPQPKTAQIEADGVTPELVTADIEEPATVPDFF